MALTSPSVSKEVRTKLTQAAELESRYVSLTSSANANTSTKHSTGLKNEAAIQQIRIKLCEIFSDVLLTDPACSERKDICGRMWRTCFHGRVQEMRDCLAKEQYRLKKIEKKNKANCEAADQDYRKVAEESENQQKRLIHDLEQNLKKFLKESVVLYEFLIDKYQGMLLPNQSTQTTLTPNSHVSIARSKGMVSTPNKTQSKSALEDITVNNDAWTFEGLVPTLHRLFIHLGDLLRYSSSFAASENAYLKASRLAPGRGNPYNQLAVITQLKDSKFPLPVVVLYWYCRSLFATDEPFPVSVSNMERLFTENRTMIEADAEWLDVMDISTVGMTREKARAAKSAASRKFLQHFTDFHGYIFRAHPDSKNGDNMEEIDKGVLIMKLNKKSERILNHFDTLLAESAFGDSLLVKMIVINAASLWKIVFTDVFEPQRNSELALTALSFFFSFGAHLTAFFTSFIGKVLTKVMSKSEDESKNQNAMRLFTPFLLTCEFISHLWKNSHDFKAFYDSLSLTEDVAQEHVRHFEEVRLNFWMKISDVANIIVSSDYFQSVSNVNLHVDRMSTSWQFECEEIRGFSPFEPFLTRSPCGLTAIDKDSLHKVPNNGELTSYISAKEAIIALELDLSQTQAVDLQSSQISSSTVVANSRRNPNENLNLKLLHFYNFLMRHSYAKETHVSAIDCSEYELIRRSDVGTFTCALIKKSATSADVVMEDVENDVMNIADDKPYTLESEGTEDLVVYKKVGSGPALLVPGELLLASNQKPSESSLQFFSDSHDSQSRFGNDKRLNVVDDPKFLQPSLFHATIDSDRKTVPGDEQVQLINRDMKNQQEIDPLKTTATSIGPFAHKDESSPMPQSRESTYAVGMRPPPGFKPIDGKMQEDEYSLPYRRNGLQFNNGYRDTVLNDLFGGDIPSGDNLREDPSSVSGLNFHSLDQSISELPGDFWTRNPFTTPMPSLGRVSSIKDSIDMSNKQWQQRKYDSCFSSTVNTVSKSQPQSLDVDVSADTLSNQGSHSRFLHFFNGGKASSRSELTNGHGISSGSGSGNDEKKLDLFSHNPFY